LASIGFKGSTLTVKGYRGAFWRAVAS
jgi:hypothetical protein